MKKIIAVLVLLGLAAAAHSQPERQVVGGGAPRYCKHPDGNVTVQGEECGYGTVEVSSVQVRRNGRMEHLPLQKSDEQGIAPLAEPGIGGEPAAAASAPVDSEEFFKDFKQRMIKWLGFALAVAVVAKLLNRSFVLWFVLGFVLRSVLVAANVMAF